MLNKAEKIPWLCASVFLIHLGMSTSVQAVGLGGFSSASFEPVLQESELVETISQDSEIAGFSCNLDPKAVEEEVLPDLEELSYITNDLIAQVGVFDSGQYSEAVVTQGTIMGQRVGDIIGQEDIVDEICELVGAPTGGGGGGGLSPLAAAPLALLFIPFGGGEPPSNIPPVVNRKPIPEPTTILGTGLALGLGVLLLRKHSKEKTNPIR